MIRHIASDTKIQRQLLSRNQFGRPMLTLQYGLFDYMHCLLILLYRCFHDYIINSMPHPNLIDMPFYL